MRSRAAAASRIPMTIVRMTTTSSAMCLRREQPTIRPRAVDQTSALSTLLGHTLSLSSAPITPAARCPHLDLLGIVDRLQIEHAWSQAISEVAGDADGEATAQAALLFSQLYRESCVKVCGLLRDAGYLLAPSSIYRHLSAPFAEALEILIRLSDGPFLFVNAQMVRLSL
jgi:hypothetical protein